MPSDAVTPRIFLIQQHYAAMQEELDWTPSRVNRLCSALKLTVHELAATIRVPLNLMDRYMRRGTFPGTVELHLLLLERATFRNSKPPVFPVLT